ncbi:MAG TPA: flagellar biosynthetic protein FliO [Alloacidobacterium sp.]|nr:flagellar biosynthetic protein FliO [Alloacidobacterium sp.]
MGRTQAGADKALRVEEKLSLGPKKMLYLVSCREQEFLIAAGADAIVSVVEVSPTKPVRMASAKKASVSRMQKREPLL